MSIIALDWGQRFVGYASSDPEGIVISPRGFFERKAPKDKTWKLLKNDILELENIFEEWEAESVVLGLPLKATGEDTPASLAARELATEIEAKLKISVFLIDESLSSWEAPSKNNHAEAAAIILKSYFNSEKTKKEPS
jgi:putative Holliday junction resolvase